MDMLAGYPWRTMDKYWRTLLDILYGDLVWRSMGYPQISLDILLGYLFQEMFMRESKRYPKSPKISEDIQPYPNISEDIRGYPMGRTPRWGTRSPSLVMSIGSSEPMQNLHSCFLIDIILNFIIIIIIII